ncbi:MAG TPA: hypothetical protein VIR57_02825 [Chloroflexota bacterium]|jgi:hypothetical protein
MIDNEPRKETRWTAGGCDSRGNPCRLRHGARGLTVIRGAEPVSRSESGSSVGEGSRA